MKPEQINQRAIDSCKLLTEQAKYLIGKNVRILSNYNGQDWGKSKKSLKGSIQMIASVFVSNDGLWIALEGYRYGCPCLAIDEWELLEN